MAGNRKNNAFNVTVGQVQVANNIGDYNNQTPSIRYPGDDYRDALDSYRKPKKELSVKDKAIDFFTRKEKGTFKERKDNFERTTTNYGIDADGKPTATNFFGDKVDYSPEKIKRFLVKDAKEKQEETNRRKLAQAEKEAAEKARKKDIVNTYGDDMRQFINPNVPPGTRINPVTGVQEIPKYYQKAPNPLTDPTSKHYLGDSVVPESLRATINETVKNYDLGSEEQVRKKAAELASGFKGFGANRSEKTINTSKSRRSGRSDSRSRGGISRGTSKSNSGSKRSARGARGGSTSRSRGGTGSGRTSTSRSASKASRSRTGRSRSQCDIRTKIDVSPLVSFNLVNDELAKLAYFVQEINK
jgi:hypothetical protein